MRLASSARSRAVRALALAVLLLAWCAAASRAASPMPSQKSREELVQQREAVVRKTLALDAQQQAAFDPVFDAYEAERKVLERERHGVLGDFSTAALAATPAQADALMDRFISLRRQRIELDEKYRPKFEAILTPQKTLLLFQLNFILDAVVNYDLAGMLPLMH